MATEQACTYDGYTAQSAGANRTAGWKFTPTEDVVVSAIRIKGSGNYTTTAQIWKDSDGSLIASTSITLISGVWVEQAIAPVTLTAGTVYIISQNVYTTYGYYGVNGVPASSYFSSKISNVSDVRIDSQNTKPTQTVGWFLAIDFIIGQNVYTPNGTAVYQTIVNGGIKSATIAWTENKPTGTSVAVSVSTDGVSYSAVTNGGQFLPPGSYDNTTAYIKVELTTTDATLTPTVSSLHLALQTAEDTYGIILEMEPLQRFESAAGPITVAYNGGGTLIGEGGAVLAFTQSFTPTGLVPKPHQNDAEHIEISSVAATVTLTKINYTNTAAQDQGHIEIASVTATGTLTKVNDI